MNRIVAYALAGALTAGLVGCAAQSSPPPPMPAVAIPASSPLAKVKVGMTMAQVADILGQPSDKNDYASGKAWIPFYYGNDARRQEWHYKGQGSVTFAGGNVFGGAAGGEVVSVNYNPSDTGYRK
jgi:outer membrane protein assembly factor BamE (lipoprotein component of BamABCDE complex)